MYIDIGLLRNILGIFVLLGIALIFSSNKRIINWNLIISAFILQNIIFLLLTFVPPITQLISSISEGVIHILEYANYGARFVFGEFVDNKKLGFIFLLVVAPTLIFCSCLVSILYFFGIIQLIIQILALILGKVVKISAVESIILIADIFLGLAESLLIASPYITSMTESELGLAFIAGLANICGSTIAIYTMFLSNGSYAENIMFTNYLLTALIMNAPSAIIFAKVLFPENDLTKASSERLKRIANLHIADNFIECVYQGAKSGLKIAVTVMATLIGVISLIHLLNGLLNLLGEASNLNTYIFYSTNGVFKGLSMEYILGEIFRIFAFLMGINWVDTRQVGNLLGQKIVLNELIAFINLGKMKASHVISRHSVFITTFALASFSNFSSVGLSLSLFNVLAPARRHEIAKIAWKSLLGAVLAGFLTATIAGLWSGCIIGFKN